MLVQEVAYEGLLREARKAGHLAAAAWLERRAGDRRNEYATLLAHHYELGEDWSKTAEFAELAGDRAAALYAHGEARGAYSQALRALSKCEPDDDDRSQPHRCDVEACPGRHTSRRLKTCCRPWRRARRWPRTSAMSSGEFVSHGGDCVVAVHVRARSRPAVVMALQVISGAKAGLEHLLVVPYLIVGRALRCHRRLRPGHGNDREVERARRQVPHEKLDDNAAWRRVPDAPLSFLGMAYQLSGQIERGRRAEQRRVSGSPEESRDLTRICQRPSRLWAPRRVCSATLTRPATHLKEAVRLAEETGDLSRSSYCARLPWPLVRPAGDLEQAERAWTGASRSRRTWMPCCSCR